jgi:hypothetical protein
MFLKRAISTTLSAFSKGIEFAGDPYRKKEVLLS